MSRKEAILGIYTFCRLAICPVAGRYQVTGSAESVIVRLSVRHRVYTRREATEPAAWVLPLQ